jgi:hypothetical protein
MDYQKKFYEKFVNDNFIFLEKIRDKSKKRTYLKIMCEKCKSVELKEQYELFKKNNILCHCCNNRKKSKPLNIEDEIKKIEENYNIKIINFGRKNNDTIIYFNCVECGNYANKSLYQFTKFNINLKHGFRCINCANKKRKWINQFKTPEVKNWFNERGIDPLFDEYKNCYTKLKLKCRCGNIFEMTFKNRLHYDDKWIPKCQECLDIERIKKL